MSNRSFVDHPNLNSSPDLPLPENYYQYRQEIPIKYSPMPSNISPPRIYEQYSMPISQPYEQRTLIRRASPQKVITAPISHIQASPQIWEQKNVVIRTPPPIAISTPRMKESQKVIFSNPINLPPVNLSPGKKVVVTPRARSNGEDLVVALKMEIERLAFLLKEKEEEVKSYKEKCVHLETHLKEHDSPHHHMNPRIQELEDRLNLLLLENQKLNHLLNDKNIEIESWRSRQTHHELAYQDAKILSARIKDLELRNGSLLEELEKWKMNFYDMDRVRTHDEHLKLSAFKEKDTAESEMKHLRNQIKAKDSEIEDLRFRYKQLENNNRDGRGLEQKLVMISGDYEKLQRMYHEKNTEYDTLKQKNYTLETTIHELRLKQDRSIETENRVALLSTEITRLNALLKERTEDLENWRMKYSKLEFSTKEINVFENDIRRTRELLDLRNKEVQEWKAKCIKYEGSVSDFKSSQNTLKEYQDRISIYVSDIERLNNSIRMKNQEIEKLEYMLNNKKGGDREVLALKEINELRLREIEELRIRCKKLEEQPSFDRSFDRNRQFDYENKITMLSTEMERLNQLLLQRNNEIESLKMRQSNVSFDNGREWHSQIDFLNSEIHRLNTIIESQNIEINEFRFRSQENGYALNKSMEQNELISALTREIEDLRRVLYEKEVEIYNNVQRGKMGYIGRPQANLPF